MILLRPPGVTGCRAIAPGSGIEGSGIRDQRIAHRNSAVRGLLLNRGAARCRHGGIRRDSGSSTAIPMRTTISRASSPWPASIAAVLDRVNRPRAGSAATRSGASATPGGITGAVRRWPEPARHAAAPDVAGARSRPHATGDGTIPAKEIRVAVRRRDAGTPSRRPDPYGDPAGPSDRPSRAARTPRSRRCRATAARVTRRATREAHRQDRARLPRSMDTIRTR